MVKLLQGYYNMQTSSNEIHGRNCDYCCDVCCGLALGQCMVDSCKFSRLANMWSSNLCFNLLEPNWFHPNCLKGHCAYRGTNMLITCPCEGDKQFGLLMQ